ncbi:MAG TPA: thioesterase domain-containing protein [Ktedonobacterales bacterium]|nr:thioesterase domain-containing protein [Ktedonobacterales bacterium]
MHERHHEHHEHHAGYDRARELEEVLHHEIPLSQQMGLTVHRYDGVCLSLRAPLAPNVNHKATAFAGSLTAVATLTGWGATWLMLREQGLRGTVVIQESNTRYLLPVGNDFIATCQMPTPLTIERFLAGLRRRGKARLPLAVKILDDDGRVAVAFTGKYVAFTPASQLPAIPLRIEDKPGEDI